MRILRSWLMILVLAGGLGLAQPGVTFGGRTRAEFGVAVDGSLPVAAAQLELNVKGEIGSGLFPDADFAGSIEASYDAATGVKQIRLGDAYGTLYLGDLELSAGQQAVFWGSTDAVNPVDVLNPRDMTFPPDSRKLPVPMLRVRYYATDEFRLEAVIVPVFTPSIPPDAQWSSAPAPSIPSGVRIVGQAPAEERRPAAELGNVQFGVRATATLPGVDVSGSYFHGFRSTPTVQATLEPAGEPGAFRVKPVLRYDRIDLVGLDASGTVGEVVLRGEAAYTFTADPDGTDPAVGNPSLQAVAGGEYVIPGGPRAVVQGILDVVAADAGRQADVRFGTLTALSYQAGTRTQLELGWRQDLDGGGAIMPKASYTLADGVLAHADAYVFYGADGTRFRPWRENAQLRVWLEYAF